MKNVKKEKSRFANKLRETTEVTENAGPGKCPNKSQVRKRIDA